MGFTKRLGLWLAATFFGGLLLAAVWTSVGALTVGNRNSVKNWLKRSDAYNRIVDVMLGSIERSDTSSQSGAVPIDRPEIRTIAENAFNATLLKANTEKFLDGTYNWLDNKTPKPVFTLDFTDAKKQLATGIGNYAKTRLASLPLCSDQEDLSDYDIFNSSCRPEGFDPTAQGALITKQLIEDKSFMANPVITADSLTVTEDLSAVSAGSEVPKVKFFEQAQIKQLPRYYRWSKLAPFIFGILVLLCAMVILWTSSTPTQGLGRVGISLLWTGGLLIVSVIMFGFVSGRLKGAVGSGQSIELKQLISSLIDAIVADVNNILLWFGISFAGAGCASLVAAYSLRRKSDGFGEYNDFGQKLAPKESPPAAKAALRARFNALIEQQKELAAMGKTEKTSTVADLAKKSKTRSRSSKKRRNTSS